MKALWLSSLAAACLVLGSAAHAGDHGRDRGYGGYRHDGHYNYEHHDRYRRDWDHDRGWHGRDYRPVYYSPARVYYRPVYYSPAPVYYGPAVPYGYGDGEIHGTISIGF